MGKTLKSNLLLLLAASIWGFAFVAQRVGAKYVGPFTFNGVRFALGSISLIPLILFYNNNSQDNENEGYNIKSTIQAGLVAGLVLFLAASLQQSGMVDTTAGKAGFITGLYIVIVPILGIFFKHHVNLSTWFGALIATIGLYLLCVTERFSISYFDLLELVGAFFWAIHILLIDSFSRKVDVLKLAFFQFVTCSMLSLVTAVLVEKITINSLQQAAIPIIYGGICSVGIAYTLQIVGQKNAKPSHAAIILSMETVIAAIGGWLILNEKLGVQAIIGSMLMFSGMILSQLPNLKKTKKAQQENLPPHTA